MITGHKRVRNGLCLIGGLVLASVSAATAQTTEPSGYQPPPTMDAGAMPTYGSALLPQRADLQEDPASVQQQVSCVVQIDRPENLGTVAWPGGGYATSAYYPPTPDSHLAAAVITSTNTIDAAAGALGITPQQRAQQVRVHGTAIGSQLLRIEVDLEKGGTSFADGDAKKLLDKLCDQVIEAFKQSTQAKNKGLEAQAAQNQQDLAALEKQLADTRAALREEGQLTAGVSPIYGDVNSMLANARMQRQQAASTLEQNQTRLAALEPTSSAALISQWETLVDQDQQRLAEVTAAHAAGNASETQVNDAQARLLDAQTHLAEAKQQSDSPGDSNRSYRTQEVANLKTTIAEDQARVKQFDQTISQLTDPKYLKALDDQRSLQTLEQSLVARVGELQSRIAQSPAPASDSENVTLTVLDGKTK